MPFTHRYIKTNESPPQDTSIQGSELYRSLAKVEDRVNFQNLDPQILARLDEIDRDISGGLSELQIRFRNCEQNLPVTSLLRTVPRWQRINHWFYSRDVTKGLSPGAGKLVTDLIPDYLSELLANYEGEKQIEIGQPKSDSRIYSKLERHHNGKTDKLCFVNDYSRCRVILPDLFSMESALYSIFNGVGAAFGNVQFTQFRRGFPFMNFPQIVICCNFFLKNIFSRSEEFTADSVKNRQRLAEGIQVITKLLDEDGEKYPDSTKQNLVRTKEALEDELNDAGGYLDPDEKAPMIRAFNVGPRGQMAYRAVHLTMAIDNDHCFEIQLITKNTQDRSVFDYPFFVQGQAFPDREFKDWLKSLCLKTCIRDFENYLTLEKSFWSSVE